MKGIDMTQEEKQKLLVALCGYLPHGIKVQRINSFYKWRKEIEYLSDVFFTHNSLKQFENTIEHLEIKPYLRPMSSMTEDEKKECEMYRLVGGGWTDDGFDWLNAHHLDWRGLIPIGLALEAPENMYK